MNQGGRILLLSTAVVLLIVGVVCLKQRLGDSHAPTPTYIHSEDPPATQVVAPHEPTVLSADASNGAPVPEVSRWHEATVLPIDEEQPPLIPTFPVHSELPSTFERVPGGPPDPDESEPGPVPAIEDSTGISPPPEVYPEIAPRVTDVPPLSVITLKDDSLWLISEKVYGAGLYYRALFAVNRDRIMRPDRIEAGIELSTPPLEELRQLYPELCRVDANRSG